ncbi:MAG TPA: C2H2-type zinc finger protein [Nitrososphaeraceae archaeon]|jgi:hypothetical protein|nr:C2H2-type zinc finger protein [Nitrososphaeraceae archaeon]
MTTIEIDICIVAHSTAIEKMRLSSNVRKKESKDMIESSKHISILDTDSINQALDRAIKEDNFVGDAIKSIESIKFPAYKNEILYHLKRKDANTEIVSLFQSLDDYIQYKDPYHVRKSIEQNIPKKKLNNQISDQKRQSPDVRVRETRFNRSIKDTEAINSGEERKDYPEVTPTAISVFICSMCGKEFQNQDDLVHHRRFERGENQVTETNENKAYSRLNKNSDSVNKAKNKKLASKLANLLEGLEFPSTKSRIRVHIRQQLSQQIQWGTADKINGTDNSILWIIENSLPSDNRKRYDNVYEIEKAAGLVTEKAISPR